MTAKSTAEVLPFPQDRIEAALDLFEQQLDDATQAARIRTRKWVTPAEAVLVGWFVSEGAAALMRNKKIGPAYYTPRGRGVVYLVAELDLWISAGRVRTTESEGL